MCLGIYLAVPVDATPPSMRASLLSGLAFSVSLQAAATEES